MNQDTSVFKEVQDRAWKIRAWLSYQNISADNREKLGLLLNEVELAAWNMERDEKTDRRVAELEKEASMADKVGEVGAGI